MFVQQYWWNGTGGNGLLIHGTGREWFTFSLDPARTGREWNQWNGTGLVFISISVSLSIPQGIVDEAIDQ